MGRRYKQGTARSQYALLPPRIEDYVGEDNTMRAIDAYVGDPGPGRAGFPQRWWMPRAWPAGIPPGALLKLYIFGYINRVHSLRRLARECRRNLEAIWLIEGLAPGYRNTPEFRKLNGRPLKAACKDFVALCKELDLLGGEVVAVDGAFFNASASDASVVTKTRLEKDLKQIELDIDAYCQGLDAQDEQESGSAPDLGTTAHRSRRPRPAEGRPADRRLQRREHRGRQAQAHRPPRGHQRRQRCRATGPPAVAAKEVLGVDRLIAVADAGFYTLKGICLPEKSGRRVIYRSEHAPVVQAHRQRMDEEGRERMLQRASLVEHPFGTLMRWFGWDHFLVRGFEKVRGEMALMVLGFNLTRVIHILGLQAFRDYCAQRLTGGRMAAQAAVAA